MCVCACVCSCDPALSEKALSRFTNLLQIDKTLAQQHESNCAFKPVKCPTYYNHKAFLFFFIDSKKTMELCFLYSRTTFFKSLNECGLRIKGVVEAGKGRETR